MLIDKNKLPPYKRRLFLFIFLSIIHIVLLLSIYFDIKYIILLIYELSFFLYFNKSGFKIILKTFIISSVIFLLNIFFSEGKIIYRFYFIKITEEGLIDGAKKAGILISTFLFTINILKDKKENILLYLQNNHKNNIIIKSINYFFIFWEELGKNISIKKLFLRVISIYKSREIKINNKKKEIIIKNDLLIYNYLFFLGFIIIFLFL